MQDILIRIYRASASLFAGTGISEVFPFTIINRAFLRAVRSDMARVDGHVMHLDRHDSLNLSVFGQFEPLETETIRARVKPGHVVVDIGANIGYYTLIMAQKAGAAGRVFAFEPDPANCAILRQNVEENGYKNVTVVQAAVADRTGKARLYLSASDQVDHRLYGSGKSRESVEVDCYRLDDYFGDTNTHVDFIKMDIQGAEGAAAAGMRGLLARSENAVVITEFWPFGLKSFGTDPGEYLAALQKLGFTLSELNETEGRLLPADPADLLKRFVYEKENFTNLLCERA